MTITALPTPPSRDDPANFATRADAFLGALPDFATEANALAAAVNADEIAADASATAAASSASAAASSASAASASASAAAASYDSFDDRYLGAKSSDPSVDNDGNALITGALYFNTTANEMRVYSGSAWVASYLPAGSYLTLTGGTMTGNITFAAGQSFDASKITGSVAIANGGTGANLTDPNADRILFWDDSASAFTFLEAGTGLSISGTTLSASGGASISAGDSNVTVSDTGSNGTVTVQTDGTERMRIDASGNVGIGVTPSAWGSSWRALQVASVGSLWGNASSSSGLYVGSNYYFDGTNRRYITTNPAIELSLGSGGTFALLQAPSGTAGNVASFTQALQLNANGGLQTLNTISVGNATPSTSGAGITFPATQSASSDANTLDDYEEGTWTPSLGGTATYSTQTGTYTKVGRVVTVRFDLAVSTLGTGSTSQMSGLPFSVGTEAYGATGYFASLAANVIGFTCYAANGSTAIFFNSISASGATATQNTAVWGNSARVQGSITYFV